MKSYTYQIIFIILISCLGLSAQHKHIGIESSMQGDALLSILQSDYKTNTVFDYSEARDTLYRAVYRENGKVEAIYSGHQVDLPDSAEDPSTFIFMGGADFGINAEHSYPQSLGASSGNPRSDMHHLFPSAVRVNSDRGSFPFGEINDTQTNKWYYLTGISGNIPNNNIDLYSEGINGKFEPRESVKGNIARAIFYFYTMYRQEADAKDPNFFWLQVEDLCDWHFNDPVDSLEWLRSFRIAQYQGDLANPYVLDCSLAGRTFCDSVRVACQEFIITDTEEPLIDQQESKIYPNPSNGANIFIELAENLQNTRLKVDIIDLSGRAVFQRNITANTPVIELNPNRKLSSGMYIVSICNTEQTTFHRLMIH